MSLYDYRVSQAIAQRDYPFYALVMALMRKADSNNITRLKLMWPEVWQELEQRYHAPGGYLEGEENV